MIPLLLALAALASGLLFWTNPGIDLWATDLFWRPGEGFYLRDFPLFRIIHDGMPYFTGTIAVALILFGLWAWRRGRHRRAAVFLLLSLIAGPGLVVNTGLKDNWGRARPSQVTEFGGTKRFTPAPLVADQCLRNCSFVAGDPAMGFWLLAPALLLAAPRRRLAAAGAVALGALFGLARIAQGGHFLSDVIFCGIAVAATVWILHWLLVERRGFAPSLGFRIAGRSRGSP
jgi:lipid A 4'-phosphatase